MVKIVILAVAALIAVPALAQPAQQPPVRYSVSGDALNRVLTFLLNGGTHNEGKTLAATLGADAKEIVAPKPQGDEQRHQ